MHQHTSQAVSIKYAFGNTSYIHEFIIFITKSHKLQLYSAHFQVVGSASCPAAPSSVDFNRQLSLASLRGRKSRAPA